MVSLAGWGCAVVQAPVSGDMDLARVSATPGALANLGGADISYIATSDGWMSYQMSYQLVTRLDIKGPFDLKGAKLGISRIGSSSEFATRLLLKKS